MDMNFDWEKWKYFITLAYFDPIYLLVVLLACNPLKRFIMINSVEKDIAIERKKLYSTVDIALDNFNLNSREYTRIN